MASDNRAFIENERIFQARMIQMKVREEQGYMNEIKEKNPRKVFVDWANSVRTAAVNGKNCLKNSTSKFSVDDASDQFAKIIGLCDAILAVLDNT